ncbi:MAG: fibronectin type III domain-containing protein [Candidatus Eisenbacteria bacterium]|nr:fibronectin type III domain-containing protein [Candidatus Eisenbacteria bacterium]
MRTPRKWIAMLAILPILFLACGDGDDDNPSGTGDVIAPSAVSDLVASDATRTSIQLTWTSTGDDTTSGTASSYDIRYAEATITAANWSSATQATGEPNPAAAGTQQTLTVTDLEGGTEYFFAMKAGDEVPNWSGLSNVAVDTTLPSSLILVASRGSHYVIVNPATGQDSVEIEPNVNYTATAWTFGYGCRRVYFDCRVDVSGASAIWGCDAFDGANVEMITDHTRMDVGDLDGSPTEEKIVFQATGVDPHYPGTNIFAIDEDGSGLTQLTTNEEMLQEPNGTNVRVNWSYMPLWSADGTKIAYWANVTVTDFGTNPHFDWIVMDADGSNKEIVFVHSGDAHYRRGGWSRDGEFLFINHADGSARKILALHLATLNESNITAGLGSTPYPVNLIAPSPQTDEIAFDRFYPSGSPLFTADYSAAGTGLSVSNLAELINNVTAGPSYNDPDWAPFYPED